MAKTVQKRDPNAIKTRVRKKIKRASELNHNQNFLIYGEAGAGKTRLAATAPKVLIVDINELGTDSVRRDINPNVYPVERWQEVNDVFWYLQEGDHDYESVALDGLTALQTLCMNFVLGDEASRDASRDPDMPSRQAWGKVGQLMKVQITNFRNLPLNTIYTAAERFSEIGDEEDDMFLKAGPEISPSIAKHARLAVGTIGYLVKREVIVKNKKKGTARKEVRRRLLVGDSERYISKDRNGLFGEYIDAPDLAEMLAMIRGEKE